MRPGHWLSSDGAWVDNFPKPSLFSGGRTAAPTRATNDVFGWLLYYKRFWRYECRQCGLQLQHVITPSYDRFGPSVISVDTAM